VATLCLIFICFCNCFTLAAINYPAAGARSGPGAGNFEAVFGGGVGLLTTLKYKKGYQNYIKGN
jgi:hypothetical protein